MKRGHCFLGVIALTMLPVSLYAAPAGSVTGEVDVIGHVGGQCSVTGGETVSSSFNGQIDLGELAGTNGRLDTSISGGPASFSVVCNTTAPHISLSATSLVGETPAPDSSYTNVVGYTAHLGLEEAGGGSETFAAVSENNGSPTPVTATLAAALSGNPNNVSVSVDTLTSSGGILTSGNYGIANPSGSGGVIAVTISPS